MSTVYSLKYKCCRAVYYIISAKHLSKAWRATVRLGDVVVFENRLPVTAAKFIYKCSLFILLPGVIRRLELKPNNEKKVELIFVAPPYCQTACCRHVLCR
jgi:hypothetical protein